MRPDYPARTGAGEYVTGALRLVHSVRHAAAPRFPDFRETTMKSLDQVGAALFAIACSGAAFVMLMLALAALF